MLAFWIAYILTRPLGASVGDYLSQARSDGGLGLGTTITSAIFLTAIVAVVAYLSLTRIDATEARYQPSRPDADVLVVAHEAAATPACCMRSGHGRARAPRGSTSSSPTRPNMPS